MDIKHSTCALVLLLFIVGIAIGFRFGLGGPEDAWLCRNGVWVRLGNPSAPMPTALCGGTPIPTIGGTACTMEAKICPDGSAVGRSGPNCEFSPCPAGRYVSLFYYNADRDKDAAGNLLCSEKGVVAVPRSITISLTPIQDTIRLLLRGELRAEEKSLGITTEYPLPGVSLVAASLRDGVLTLTLADPQNKTGGGSCRVSILRAQIEATAKQFDGVREVRLMPEELFQP